MKRHLLSLASLLFAAAVMAAGTPKITVADPIFDFGNIPENDGPVSHSFTITNTGDAPLIIISATASCGCTTPVIPKEPVKPGATTKLKVTFDPLGRPGEFEKSIRVKSNVKGKRTTLRIKGCVIPKPKAHK